MNTSADAADQVVRMSLNGAEVALKVSGKGAKEIGLSFTLEAGKTMGLSEDKSLTIFESDSDDLGATITEKGDPEAFVLKKCGPYFYIAFRNYLKEAGIDYKKNKIIYDISQLDEKFEGRTLFKFERRILPRDPKDIQPSEQVEDDDDDNQSPSEGKAETNTENKE